MPLFTLLSIIGPYSSSVSVGLPSVTMMICLRSTLTAASALPALSIAVENTVPPLPAPSPFPTSLIAFMILSFCDTGKTLTSSPASVSNDMTPQKSLEDSESRQAFAPVCACSNLPMLIEPEQSMTIISAIGGV